MRVQRVLMPEGSESWTVLGPTGEPIGQVEAFLAHLQALDRSPTTLRTYATSLKLWLQFLDRLGVAADEATVDHVSRFVAWLRSPADNVAVLEGGSGRTGPNRPPAPRRCRPGIAATPRTGKRGPPSPRRRPRPTDPGTATTASSSSRRSATSSETGPTPAGAQGTPPPDRPDGRPDRAPSTTPPHPASTPAAPASRPPHRRATTGTVEHEYDNPRPTKASAAHRPPPGAPGGRSRKNPEDTIKRMLPRQRFRPREATSRTPTKR